MEEARPRGGRNEKSGGGRRALYGDPDAYVAPPPLLGNLSTWTQRICVAPPPHRWREINVNNVGVQTGGAAKTFRPRGRGTFSGSKGAGRSDQISTVGNCEIFSEFMGAALLTPTGSTQKGEGRKTPFLWIERRRGPFGGQLTAPLTRRRSDHPRPQVGLWIFSAASDVLGRQLARTMLAAGRGALSDSVFDGGKKGGTLLLATPVTLDQSDPGDRAGTTTAGFSDITALPIPGAAGGGKSSRRPTWNILPSSINNYS